jgi:hypothetical protein
VIVAALDERRSATSDDGEDDTPSADEAAAERLLARHARALDRVADPRARRQRAYALLARNGFDPATCASASAALMRGADIDEGVTPE